MPTSYAPLTKNSGLFKSVTLNMHCRESARLSEISPASARRRLQSVLQTRYGLNEFLSFALLRYGCSGLLRYASGLLLDGLILSILFWWDGTVSIRMPSGLLFPMTLPGRRQLARLSPKAIMTCSSLMKHTTSKPPIHVERELCSEAAMIEFLQTLPQGLNES